MHFVKKVPTTDEEKAAREKLRSSKLRAYCTMRDKVFDKRDKGELDEELLELTATLLSKNPDVYTFWNIRRAAVQSLMNKKEDSDEEVTKRNDTILSAELPLTEQCLMENPKSYGAWHHRGWALEHITERDFNRELKTTEKALQLDARNFHCWDHRRLVVNMAGISIEDELKFSERMINANFSNYSAWHYRSTLLPLAANKTSDAVLDDEVIAEELKRLANAFFTDPEDQSAWKYTEWLISMDPQNNKEGKSAKLVTVSLEKGNRSAVVVLDSPLCADELKERVVFKNINENLITIKPVSVFPRAKHSRMFILDSQTDIDTIQLISSSGDISGEINLKQGPYVDKQALYKAYAIQKPKISLERVKALKSVIDNCRALIEEMKSEKTQQLNKWPLFTLTRCLTELDPIENHKEIQNNLYRLSKELDPQRAAVYEDMRDKLTINEYLRSENEGMMLIDSLIEKNGGGLSLKSEGLKSLSHLQLLGGLITTLDLSDNAIKYLHDFVVFPRLEHLTLNENPLINLAGLKHYIPRVEFLSVASTCLVKTQDIAPILESASLKRFIFCETKLAQDDKESEKVYEMVKESGKEIKLIRHWL